MRIFQRNSPRKIGLLSSRDRCWRDCWLLCPIFARGFLGHQGGTSALAGDHRGRRRGFECCFASVVASIKEIASKRERLQPPISIGGKKPEEVKAEVISQLAKISAILEGKVPADQADGYKSWLLAVAGKVANAATEGGIFGFGGEKVSAAETAAINELASSLGVKA